MQADSSSHSDQVLGEDTMTQKSTSNSAPQSQKGGVNKQPSSDSRSQTQSKPVSITKRSVSDTEDKAGNDSWFDSFWGRIEQGFKKEQKNKGETSLPWREDFRRILLKENTRDNNWNVDKQEWQNCEIQKQMKGGTHQRDYCGYVEFNNGSSNYKMQVSYMWKPQQKNETWTIKIVKGGEKSFQYYSDGDWKTWTGHVGSCTTIFDEESNQSCNMWGKINPPSISINDTVSS